MKRLDASKHSQIVGGAGDGAQSVDVLIRGSTPRTYVSLGRSSDARMH